jgi:hypothetical protein
MGQGIDMSNYISSHRGKFVKKGSMEAVKVCDRSGLWFSESDICVEKEWRGDSLVPTGFLVGRPYLIEPNEQFRTPKVSNDPQPVNKPRPLTNGDRFDYTAEPIFNDGLPNGASNPPLLNIGGRDVSNITADQRLALLHAISGSGS